MQSANSATCAFALLFLCFEASSAFSINTRGGFTSSFGSRSICSSESRRSIALSRPQIPLLRRGRATIQRTCVMADISFGADSIASAQSVSFQEAQEVAIQLGMEMVDQLKEGDNVLSESKELLSALLSHSDGARGWWVTSLTVADMEPLFESKKGSDAMAVAVLANPDPNRNLLTMNVAMSTATAEYWTEQGEEKNAEGALLTQRRTARLLRALLPSLSGLQTALEQLKLAAEGEEKEGEWAEFLNRWNYGTKQRQAIASVLEQVLEPETQ